MSPSVGDDDLAIAELDSVGDSLELVLAGTIQEPDLEGGLVRDLPLCCSPPLRPDILADRIPCAISGLGGGGRGRVAGPPGGREGGGWGGGGDGPRGGLGWPPVDFGRWE